MLCLHLKVVLLAGCTLSCYFVVLEHKAASEFLQGEAEF